MNKLPQTGWRRKLKFVVSQFWRLEDHDQGASCSGLGGKDLSTPGLSPWLVDRHLLSMSFYIIAMV